MSDSSNLDNIVDEHRKMVILTGNISDFQIENLQKWPFVAFGENLEKVEIDYNFVQGTEKNGDLFAGKVNFDFEFKKEPENPKQELDFLIHCTRYMFWNDTKVTFTNKGKEWPKIKV